MTKEPYGRIIDRVPGVAQELEQFREILRDGYDCSRLPIPHIHKMRHRKSCDDVADYFVDRFRAAGLSADKYLILDIERHERDKAGRIVFASPRELIPKDHPHINPWGLHFICGAEGFAIDPLINGSTKIGDASLALFGEQVPVHQVDTGRTYSFWDLVDVIELKGLLEND